MTFLRLVGVVFLLAALDLWADETKPYGIDKRVLWTTSCVVGSPEPPSPYATELSFPKLKFDHPVEIVSAPGSDRLVIAGVGAGGKEQSDISNFYKSGKADIAYLCDVDDRRAANTVKNFPKAKYYKDWREMFEKEAKNFDASFVEVPRQRNTREENKHIKDF